MPAPARKPPARQQARTQATQSRILDAAQTLFADLGFEGTQLEQVATHAGYSRGAIYAHFSSKEDLFLALVEQRVHTKFALLRKRVENEPEVSKRTAIFKHWIASQVRDPSWGNLMLEFKLYALRRPSSREKLQHLYDLLFRSSGRHFIELLFGPGLDAATRRAAERRLAIMGGILSAAVLESHFRPRLLAPRHLQRVLEELFDALIHA